jgi:hypothetical protein
LPANSADSANMVPLALDLVGVARIGDDSRGGFLVNRQRTREERRIGAMKKFLLSIIILMSAPFPVWGQTVGVINNDGQVGLPEAINALQISAGIRTAQNLTVYDLADYLGKVNQAYVYDEVSPSYGTSMVFVTKGEEEIDGQASLIRN